MGAVSALRTTGGALARNPVILVGTFLVALLQILVQVPQFVAQVISDPAVALLVALLVPVLAFFITPFFTAGVFGMASEAVAGGTSLGTFVRVGKARYVTLLLATLLYSVLAVVLAIAFVIIGAIAALVAGVAFSGGGDPGSAMFIVFALVVLVLVIVYLLFTFFLQFFAVAAVVSEVGVTECFTRSYRLVRRNLLSTLGYNVLAFLVSLLVAIPFVVLAAVALVLSGGLPTAPPTPGVSGFGHGFGFSVAILVAGAVGLLVLQTLTRAITMTYSVAFYRDRRAPEEGESVV